MKQRKERLPARPVRIVGPFSVRSKQAPTAMRRIVDKIATADPVFRKAREIDAEAVRLERPAWQARTAR